MDDESVSEKPFGWLCLTRRCQESISIGDDIKVTVIQIKGGQVRLGIWAPDHIVLRSEIAAKKPLWKVNEPASTPPSESPPDPSSASR